MDDELAIVLRERGFGEITYSDPEHLVHRIETRIDGSVDEDFSFDFNDWFSEEQIREVVHNHVANRFDWCDVEVEVVS